MYYVFILLIMYKLHYNSIKFNKKEMIVSFYDPSMINFEINKSMTQTKIYIRGL